jgi:hypothetical protein
MSGSWVKFFVWKGKNIFAKTPRPPRDDGIDANRRAELRILGKSTPSAPYLSEGLFYIASEGLGTHEG